MFVVDVFKNKFDEEIATQQPKHHVSTITCIT